MPKNLKEISLKTIKSYKSKAEIANAGNTKNAAANDKMAKKAAVKGSGDEAMGHLQRAKAKRTLVQKRNKGLEMANKRLGEGTFDTFRQDKIDKYGTRYKESSSFKQGHELERKRIKKQFGKDSKSYKNHMKDAMKNEESINERGLSPAEKRDKEDIVKGMKKNKTDFMKRYGRESEGVMYATATKLAKEEIINELDKDTLKSYVGKAQAERLHNIDKFEKQSKRGESIIAKSALKKVQKRGMGIRQAQKKLGEAEFDADKPKRGIQRKRVNLQFGRQQRHNPTPYKKDQQQDLYKKSDPVEKKIKKSRENKRFPDYRQDKDTGTIKKDFLPGGEHAKKYGGLQNKKTKPNVTSTTEDRVINQLKILIAENKYDLYSSGEHKTASRFAEKEIDRHLAKAKKMKDYHTARTHMDKVLSKHAKHGSDDSEPHQIVTGHLNNHFGTKHGHNDHLDFMKGRPEYSGPRVKPVKENFQDGKNPEDKGDSKRHGLSGKQSSSSLKKVRSSDSASPRKKQLAHWILNMRKGRNKKK